MCQKRDTYIDVHLNSFHVIPSPKCYHQLLQPIMFPSIAIFPSKAENPHIVTKMHRLVCALKNSVGDEVDLTPLNRVEEGVEEV